MAGEKIHDLIIIGAGPAGLTAAIYAARQKLDLLIFEGQAPGGQILLTDKIENYPGFEKITGQELSEKLVSQAKKWGVKITSEEVAKIIKKKDCVEIETAGKKKYSAKSIIIATGAAHRPLNVKGEKEFLGKGVSYCATCDGPLFKNKIVAVIGGGNTAVYSALYMNELCKKVYLIHRRDELKADAIEIERLKKSSVELILNFACDEISGGKKVASIKLKNLNTNEEKELAVDGVFIDVGISPLTAIAQGAGVNLDSNGYIKVDSEMKTNVDGVFAAGDVTGSLKQVATAVGQGAIAAMSAYKYIKGR